MKTPPLAHQCVNVRWFAPVLATILIASASIVAQAKTLNAASLAELKVAMKEARPGDSIVMADGGWRDAVINFSAQATAERPVIIRAQTPGKVFLTGASKLTLNSPFLVVDGLFFRDGSSEDGSPVIAFKSHHGRITNTAIVNFNPASGRANSWVLFDGEHNRLDHCFFEGKNNRGPLVANSCCQSRHHRVESCYFKDIVYVAENGREIIQVQGVGRSDHYGKDGAFFIANNLIYKPAGGTAVSAQAQDNSAPLDRLTFRPNQFQANIVFGGVLKIKAPSSDATGFSSADPKLVRRDGLFRPASDSPAINAAAGDYVKDDVEGQPRSKSDIGADELSNKPVIRRPLTPRDVGPSWMR
jgi:Chondroitinase B